MKKLNTRQIALNGIVAGLYAAITILTASFAYGNIQFRISEALMMLLLFEPHLTIGLTIGCLIANLFSTVSVLDIVIGTAATLLACLLTTRIKKPWLAPLPTILVNAVMVGAMLRAGADEGATGENAAVVCCRRADVIIGPVGIVIADALLGEVTPRMAVAVGQSAAKRILIPVNHCANFIAGVADMSVGRLVDSVVAELEKTIRSA